MAHSIERLALLAPGPGTVRELVVHRFGTPGARPCAYFQAAMHANETPALLVAHHLCARLAELDAQGKVSGEVVLVPYANPIGLTQYVSGGHAGRYELGSGINFNRGYPSPAARVIERIEGCLGDDPSANQEAIRRALMEAAASFEADNEWDYLKARLVSLAAGCDLVFDLHCHGEALLYLYIGTPHPQIGAELARQMGSRTTFIGSEVGSGAFDETFTMAWSQVIDAYPAHRIAHGCLAVTVELRGQAHVSDELAAGDAANLVKFLMRRGAIEGDPGQLPEPLCEAVPLRGVDHLRAETAGVVVYKKELGAVVEAGEVIAEVLDPAATDPAAARTPVATRTDGVLFGRNIERYVRPGMAFASVAGAVALVDEDENPMLDR